MLVLDASILIELALNTEGGRSVADRIAAGGHSLHVPHLADAEVAHTLRRQTLFHGLDEERAGTALATYRALEMERYAHKPLLGRVWHLRANLTAYDALYVALAEALDSVLITCDRRLARAPGHFARVEFIPRGGALQ